jgi:TfoX/Sxy family transcriptional regulator of competence genes
MGSSIGTVQYICDQAALGSRLAFKRMFGEYALYLDGKIVALICDDQLFLKATAEGRAYLGKVSEAPPYPGAKNHFLPIIGRRRQLSCGRDSTCIRTASV